MFSFVFNGHARIRALQLSEAAVYRVVISSAFDAEIHSGIGTQVFVGDEDGTAMIAGNGCGDPRFHALGNLLAIYKPTASAILDALGGAGACRHPQAQGLTLDECISIVRVHNRDYRNTPRQRYPSRDLPCGKKSVVREQGEDNIPARQGRNVKAMLIFAKTHGKAVP